MPPVRKRCGTLKGHPRPSADVCAKTVTTAAGTCAEESASTSVFGTEDLVLLVASKVRDEQSLRSLRALTRMQEPRMQEPPIFSGHMDSRLAFWSRTLSPGASIVVKCIPGKGLGVCAAKPIARKTLVACWQLRVFHQEGHENSNYAVALGKRPFVADLDESLIPHEPHSGTPRIGMLLNEPGLGENRNCCNFFDSGDHTQYIAGDVLTMELYTTRAVPEGEELTWDYGPGFKRNYPSRYTKQRTSPRNQSNGWSISA